MMKPKVNELMVKPITGMSPLSSNNQETHIVMMATTIDNAPNIYIILFSLSVL
jgi:hypothetical protein